MAACTMSMCRGFVLNSVARRSIGASFKRTFWNSGKPNDVKHVWPRRRIFGGVLLGIGSFMAVGVAVKQPIFDKSENSTEIQIKRPKLKPIRTVKSDTDSTGLKLTLYQYQNCPFCCKVRAYLDYHGFSYEVIEVNSVRRSEIKWSQYKKVPILVCENNGDNNSDKFIQMNDSSLIISILESFLEDRSLTVEQLVTYYPALESVNKRGKKIYEYPNKYFIMFGNAKVPSYREDEWKWRKWTDDVLVHTLSPNIYRTPGESIQAFQYFSEVGEWNKAFSAVERSFIIYVGSAAMYFIGKMLKKRHALKDDVRLSMYDACNEWTAALSKQNTPFMGGSEPNVADLAVYGVLSSIEGCHAFQDLTKNTKILDWFTATKNVISKNAGRYE